MTFEVPVRLETARLLLRPYGLDDHDQVVAIVEAGDQATALSPGGPSVAADAKEWLAEGVHELQRSGDGLHLAIVTREGELAGAISLFRTDWAAGTTEVGYGVRPRFRGQGLAPEAVLTVARWAFTLGLHRVELRNIKANSASQRVAEKAGFTLEGVLRQAQLEDDGLHDLLVFGLLASDLEMSPSP